MAEGSLDSRQMEDWWKRLQEDQRYLNHGRFPRLRDTLNLYSTTRDLLSFRDLENWRTYLLALSTVYFLARSYLFYRQHRVLQKSTRPKVLQNVLTDTEFSARITHQLSETKFSFCYILWKLIMVFLLTTFDVLPKIWRNLDIFISKYADRSYVTSYEIQFEHPVILPLFYLACALLWELLMAPVTYYNKCIQGTGPPKHSKQTIQEWISELGKNQFGYFWKIYLLIWFGEGNIHLNVHRRFHQIFNELQGNMVLSIAYTLIVRPLVPARFFNFAPLKAGKTKTAIENLAKELKFPLGNIYRSPSKHDSETDILISGWSWKRNVAIPEKVLEKCNTEDIVALVAAKIGNRKHNVLHELTVKYLAYGLYSIPIWIFHFNWKVITKSFGFNDRYVFTAQHPFQVIILILGGAIDPLFHLINMYIYNISRDIESKSDALAVKRRYGKQLARALIKLGKDSMDVPVIDWAYFIVFNDGHDMLSDILKRLGWTGEEEMEKEGEKENMHDHWEVD